MLIDLRDVSVSFADGDDVVRAVHDASFSARHGELVVLHGPSGSGKTTLLNVIAGLQSFESGSVHVAQRDLSQADDDARALMRLHHVGVVFQENNLIREFAAAENVELPLRARGQSASDAAVETQEMLERVGIGLYGKRLPRQLSGGQRQRVGIARALVGGRSVLVADEPTGALDTSNSRAVFDLLRSFADRGVCVVVASHDPEALRVADRCVRMADGRILPGGGE